MQLCITPVFGFAKSALHDVESTASRMLAGGCCGDTTRLRGVLAIFSSAAIGPIPNARASANASVRTIIASLRLFICRHGDASRDGMSRTPLFQRPSGLFVGVSFDRPVLARSVKFV